MGEVISVFFPQDNRNDDSKNRLLDGTIHDIEVYGMSTFEKDGLNFYIVNGYDSTRECSIQILLVKDGNSLKKVPLLDYNELSQYEFGARILYEDEIHSILANTSYYASSKPITTISNLVEQEKAKTKAMSGNNGGNGPDEEEYDLEKEDEKTKDKIVVFGDRDGRRYILASAAEYIGLPRPRSVSYLPIKFAPTLETMYGIYPTSGFRLLNKEEYEWISREYIIDEGLIQNVLLVEYKGDYFIRSELYAHNHWGLSDLSYSFDEWLNSLVKITPEQKRVIETYYSVDTIWANKLVNIVGDKRIAEREWMKYSDERPFRL